MKTTDVPGKQKKKKEPLKFLTEMSGFETALF